MFLRWQLSESYDFICMTSPVPYVRMKEASGEPKREIYGIRFVPRAKWNEFGRLQ